jgi:hypothetical protein
VGAGLGERAATACLRACRRAVGAPLVSSRSSRSLPLVPLGLLNWWHPRPVLRASSRFRVPVLVGATSQGPSGPVTPERASPCHPRQHEIYLSYHRNRSLPARTANQLADGSRDADHDESGPRFVCSGAGSSDFLSRSTSPWCNRSPDRSSPAANVLGRSCCLLLLVVTRRVVPSPCWILLRGSGSLRERCSGPW